MCTNSVKSGGFLTSVVPGFYTTKDTPGVFAMEINLSGNGDVQELFISLDSCESVREIANFESIYRGEEVGSAKAAP